MSHITGGRSRRRPRGFFKGPTVGQGYSWQKPPGSGSAAPANAYKLAKDGGEPTAQAPSRKKPTSPVYPRAQTALDGLNTILRGLSQVAQDKPGLAKEVDDLREALFDSQRRGATAEAVEFLRRHLEE